MYYTLSLQSRLFVLQLTAMITRIFLTLILSANVVSAQPATQKPARKQQNANEQSSPAASNQSDAQRNNESNTASQGKQAKQSDEARAFQQTQIRQYWILVVTGVITTLALIVYTVFSGLQWRDADRQSA